MRRISVRLNPSPRFKVLNDIVNRAKSLAKTILSYGVLWAPDAKGNMCDDYREVAMKQCRCLRYFDSCLFLLFPYEGHVLRDLIASDRLARPQRTFQPCVTPRPRSYAMASLET